MKKLMSTAFLAHSFSKVQNFNFDNCKFDQYKGCYLKANLDPYIHNPTLFKQHLIEFISLNKSKNLTAIWIDLQQNQLSLAPFLIEQGFKMHRVGHNKLQFSKWLPDGESRLPPQASHFIGVGGIVVQDGKILLVQEKNGNRKGAWGTPGGIVDKNESLIQAVKREVKEETNLNCDVQDVLYFREMHDAKFGKTDLYFAFRLSCNNVSDIKICQDELMDYRWIPVNELSQFLSTQDQKPHVLNFYKSVQERLQGGDKKYMTISQNEEMYYEQMRQYAVFKPRF